MSHSVPIWETLHRKCAKMTLTPNPLYFFGG